MLDTTTTSEGICTTTTSGSLSTTNHNWGLDMPQQYPEYTGIVEKPGTESTIGDAMLTVRKSGDLDLYKVLECITIGDKVLLG